MSSTIRDFQLFRNLFLASPTPDAPSEWISRLHQLLPLLRDFDQKIHPSTNFDVESAFLNFKSSEMSLWPLDKDARLMVSPSGSITSSLALHLHYPTMKTDKLWDGETADIKSPCTRMLLTAGFSPRHTFWWDSHPWREAAPFEPSRAYSKAILASHASWENTLRENQHAKIELVVGKANQNILTEKFGPLIEEFILWDDQHTPIFIKYTNVARYSIDRIFVFVNHPQFYFYDHSMKEAICMDSKLKIASDMAGITRTKKEETYFVWRAQDQIDREKDRLEKGIAKVIKRKRDPEDEDPNKPRKYRGTGKSAKTDPYLLFPRNLTIEIRCDACGLLGIDTKPAFWIKDPRIYVMHSKARCKGCANQKDVKIYDLPTADIPWMRSDLSYLQKDPSRIIKTYNTWAAQREGRTRVLNSQELWDIKEEEQMARDEICWELSDENEILDFEEEDYRDYEHERLARADRRRRNLKLGAVAFWGPVEVVVREW